MASVNSSEKYVVILDPALRELGGHHPATIQSVAESTAVKSGKLSVEVFANAQCPEEYMISLRESKVRLVRHFETDFYRYFYWAQF